LPPGTLQKLPENAFVTATAAGKLLVVPMCYHSITLEAVTAAALEDRLLAGAVELVGKLLTEVIETSTIDHPIETHYSEEEVLHNLD